MTGYSDSAERVARAVSLERHHGLVVQWFSGSQQLPDEYEVVLATADGLYHWIEPDYESTREISCGFTSREDARCSCLRHIEGATQDESRDTQQ